MQTIEFIKARIKRLEDLISAMPDLTVHPTPQDLKDDITAIANSYGVDPAQVLAIIGCESGFQIDAINENAGGSIDRGLCQWNDFYHPEITDAMAFDRRVSVEKMCEAIKAGHINWWNSSKKCWAK